MLCVFKERKTCFSRTLAFYFCILRYFFPPDFFKGGSNKLSPQQFHPPNTTKAILNVEGNTFTGIQWSMFNLNPLPEDEERVEGYFISPEFGFYAVFNFLNVFEITFRQNMKLDADKLAFAEQIFVKFFKI